MIRAIDRSAVQKICSGQVVVDLATAVKEMVENSLDSGATSIEVKLKEMGATLIEVSDNGSGIDPSNYAGIAMKHFTSKLQTFEDIYSVSSFGFRGEALNALCELSERFTVTTKQDSQPVGTLLEFDKNGKLISESVAARATGTTVSVENLFEKLPVRRKEFVKSIKKHFQKMVRIVQSYALISVGVKIIVTNTNASGGKQTLLATQSGGKLSDNVSILFGAKFAGSLLPVDLRVDLQSRPGTAEAGAAGEGPGDGQGLEAYVDDSCESTLGEKESPSSVAASQEQVFSAETAAGEGSAEQSAAPTVRVCGLVSKVGLGVGRSDNDRQFTFCNGRPVDLPRFSKALNEVWRRYEMKQKPAFVLDITVPAGYFDVNLTPDKREVLIVQEADILQQLRDAVDCLYAPVRHTMQLNQGMAETKLSATWPALQTAYTPNSKADTSNISRVTECEDTLEEEGGGLLASCATGSSRASQATQSGQASSSPLVWASQSDRDSLLQRPSSQNSSSSLQSLAGESASKRQRLDGSAEQQHRDSPLLPFPVSQSQQDSQNSSSPKQPSQASAEDATVQILQERKKISWKIDAAEAMECMKAHSKRRTVVSATSVNAASSDPVVQESESGVAEDAFDITANAPSATTGTGCHSNAATFADRSQARVLTKKDFPRMRVLGQFNLGFVIAELDGDLYILDQHACDEKYRFELLQRTTKLHQQPLILPLAVETSAALELVIAEHQEVFAQNGFKLAVDLTAPAGQRVKLLSVPFSKTVHFGMDDVNELASMLSERSGAGSSLDSSSSSSDATNQRTDKTYLSLKNDFLSNSQSGSTVERSGDTTTATTSTTAETSMRNVPRLPKLLSMFASRACRSAIMIGTALRVSEMERVVARLEQVEQPWNCPHGRPTLRHLVDLTPYWNARKRKCDRESKYIV